MVPLQALTLHLPVESPPPLYPRSAAGLQRMHANPPEVLSLRAAGLLSALAEASPQLAAAVWAEAGEREGEVKQSC